MLSEQNMDSKQNSSQHYHSKTLNIYAINDKLVFSTNEIEDMMKNTGHSVSIRVRKAGTTLYISEMRIK